MKKKVSSPKKNFGPRINLDLKKNLGPKCVEIIWVEKMFRAEQKYRSKTISVLESTKNFGSEKDFGEGSKLWGIVH